MLRRALVAAVAVTFALAASTGTAWATDAERDAEAEVLHLINELRASVRLPALGPDPELQAMARWWSASMATMGDRLHNDRLPSLVEDWELLGENVGVGRDLVSLHQAFVRSHSHYANLVRPEFESAGIGVVIAGGRIWVTELFRQRLAPRVPVPPPARSAPASALPPSSAAPPVSAAAVASHMTAPLAASDAPVPAGGKGGGGVGVSALAPAGISVLAALMSVLLVGQWWTLGRDD